MNQQANILIVDDDPSVRNAIEDALGHHGFSVRGAANGLEALELMREQAPDLILADIIMPEMNGYQLYNRVRNQEQWLWIPFIFITAKDKVDDVRYGRELGVDDYIKKPFESEDLLAAVIGKLERFHQLGKREKLTVQPNPESGNLVAIRLSIQSLSPREREVLFLLAQGLSNAQIANELIIGVSTVKTHVVSILSKLGAGNRVEAAALVMQAGLDSLDDRAGGSPTFPNV
jgi:DNA-binding NarL/FixJ family response regulator